jgi:hypothetical protein
MHNILNNLPRSLILINFHFGRRVSKLLAIRPVVTEITDLSKSVSVAESTQIAATGKIDGMVHPVVD